MGTNFNTLLTTVTQVVITLEVLLMMGLLIQAHLICIFNNQDLMACLVETSLNVIQGQMIV